VNPQTVAADFATILQRAGETRDADLYDFAFAADVLWAAPSERPWPVTPN
jgi:hypothetical protein